MKWNLCGYVFGYFCLFHNFLTYTDCRTYSCRWLRLCCFAFCYWPTRSALNNLVRCCFYLCSRAKFFSVDLHLCWLIGAVPACNSPCRWYDSSSTSHGFGKGKFNIWHSILLLVSQHRKEESDDALWYYCEHQLYGFMINLKSVKAWPFQESYGVKILFGKDVCYCIVLISAMDSQEGCFWTSLVGYFSGEATGGARRSGIKIDCISGICLNRLYQAALPWISLALYERGPLCVTF